MNLGSRIRTAFELAGLRAPDVSRAAEVPVAAINALLRRDSKRSEYTEKILAVIPASKVSHAWVRTGAGSPTPWAQLRNGSNGPGENVGEGEARNARPLNAAQGAPPRSWEYSEQWPQESHVLLPRLGVYSAKDGRGGREKVSIKLVKHEVLAFTTGWMKYDKYRPTGLAWAQVTDNSMETVLYEGDFFVVDTGQTEVVDGRTYVIFYEGRERVRRLFRLPGGRLRIEASNGPLFPTLELAPSEVSGVKVVGRVVHRSGAGGL